MTAPYLLDLYRAACIQTIPSPQLAFQLLQFTHIRSILTQINQQKTPCPWKIKQAKYGLKVSLHLLPLLSDPPDERGAWKLAIYLHTNAYILYIPTKPLKEYMIKGVP